MKTFEILFWCIFLSSVNCNTENDCRFRIFQKNLTQVSNDVKIPLKIRFNLQKFNKYCILKVKTPFNETSITFNLTKREHGDKSDFFGDNLRERISVNYKRTTLKIENSLKINQYSKLSGNYQINEKSIFVLPYTQDSEQEVKGLCEEDKGNNVTIKARVAMNELFSLCFEYNMEVLNKSVDNFLLCKPGICSSQFTVGNQSFFNLTTFNRSHTDFNLRCIPDPSTKYSLKLKVNNNCPTPVNSWILTLVIALVVLALAVLILIIWNIKNTKETRILKKNNKATCPEWAKELFYNRGLLNIYTKDPLGQGDFGIVYKAMTQHFGSPQSRSSPSTQLVAVKTYPPNSAQGHDDLHQEGELLSTLPYHPNIINLLAVSLDTSEFCNRVLLINELCSKGSLLELLRKKQEEINKGGEAWSEEFNPEVMTLWAFQICRGMEFLSMKNIIHGDLAARNILLDENSTVKINDFGKSHKVNYDNIGVSVSGYQPMAWMAPEAIENREVTLLSDLWAYGITIWEIFSLGKHPYGDMQLQGIFNSVSSGYRLPKPELCPGKIYSLMKNCWHEEPKLRPQWTGLKEAMEGMVEAKYLDKYFKIEDAYKMIYSNIRNYTRMDSGGMSKNNKEDAYVTLLNDQTDR